MTDLSPTHSTPKRPPKGGHLVTLGMPLFVLKARYTGPDGKERALPKHRWTLIGSKPGAAAIGRAGTESDSDGISSIPFSEDLLDPSMTWHLSWQPVFDHFDDLLQWANAKEAWIDIDKKPRDKGAWVAAAKLQSPEHRRLLRMPAWTTRVKSQNGQFNEAPTEGFKTTGTLSAAEIAAKVKERSSFGTRAKPWLVFVDHGWFRTVLQFRFYDFKQKEERAVPPGLVVRAKQPDGTTVGGGTAFDLDGNILVLHERTKAASSTDVEYEFVTGDKITIVDLEAAAPPGAAPSEPGKDERVVKLDKLPDGGPVKRYPLPAAWHSRAMQAFVVGTGARSRKPFASLRGEDTSFSQPLAFHLDDVVLFDAAANAPSILPADSRIVLFDHRLKFRGPFDPVIVHMLKEKVSGHYLRAEDLIVKKGDAFVDATFVINHESNFFVLREGRIPGVPGAVDNVGARMASARAPENPIGNFLGGYPDLGGAGTVELHFFPDAYDGPYDEARDGKFLKDHPKAKLGHVLVYVPLKVVPAAVGTRNFDAPTPADVVAPANMNSVFQALLDAAERWDQAHPGGGATGKKDYVIVPDAGVKDGTRVIKLRHYFGARTDDKHKFTIVATYKNQLTTLGDRAFVSKDDKVGPLMSLVVSPRPPAAPAWTITSDEAQDSDGVRLPWFTLAHELGHVMGLPDEYAENLTIPDVPAQMLSAEPRVIRFGQAHEGYPFYADLDAMMRSNKLPRLRYIWHHIAAFMNKGAAKPALPEGPYIAHAPAFTRGTGHKISDGNTTQPWEVLAQRSGPAGRSNVILYRTGDDEATVESIFPRPASFAATPGAWLHGILVVSPKIWFNFLPSAAGDFPDHASQFKVMYDFHLALFDRAMKPQQRFVVEAAPTLRLPRIAILFQPRMEFGPVPQPLTGFAPPTASEGAADFVVDVVFQTGVPHRPAIRPGGWPPSSKPRVELAAANVGLGLLRFALGITATAPTLNNGPILAAELTMFATLVRGILGDPTESAPRVVRPLPR